MKPAAHAALISLGIAPVIENGVINRGRLL